LLVRFGLSALFLTVFGCGVLCAADLAHGAVAALTRAGIVAGPYGSYNHGALVPTLVAALALGALALLNVVGEALARSARIRGDWVAHVAARISEMSPLRLAPAVFAGQLIALFAMESIEQIAAFGHPLGFIASLGAPIVVALAVHALATIIVVTSISYGCRALTFAVGAIAEAFSLPMQRLAARHQSAASNVRRLAIEADSKTGRLTPLARRIANRPPPLQVPALS
jgi:hypothetical protein